MTDCQCRNIEISEDEKRILIASAKEILRKYGYDEHPPSDPCVVKGYVLLENDVVVPVDHKDHDSDAHVHWYPTYAGIEFEYGSVPVQPSTDQVYAVLYAAQLVSDILNDVSDSFLNDNGPTLTEIRDTIENELTGVSDDMILSVRMCDAVDIPNHIPIEITPKPLCDNDDLFAELFIVWDNHDSEWRVFYCWGSNEYFSKYREFYPWDIEMVDFDPYKEYGHRGE